MDQKTVEMKAIDLKEIYVSCHVPIFNDEPSSSLANP
jgi:hypothetical protein